MSEKQYIKICDSCAQFCLFIISKVAGSMEEAKGAICKKKNPCYTYRVTTKGDKNG